MQKLIFYLILFLAVVPASAASLDLDLRDEKIRTTLGILDPHDQVPNQVLTYIREKEGLNSNRGRALLQLAKDYITAIQSLGNPKLADQRAKQILKSEFCIRFIFGKEARFQNSKIHGLTLNTYELSRLGIRLNTHIANGLPYLPEEPQWKNECRFAMRGEKS